ncbi:MAG: iron ABC transporter permease, partial [Myxococcota bacterium]
MHARRSLRLLFAVLVAVLCLPLIYLVWRAWQLGAEPAQAVFGRGHTWAALGRTLLLGIGVAGLSVALAVPLAWLTHACDLPGRRLFRVALNLPLAVPSYVSGFVVVTALAPAGVVHDALVRIGIEIEVYGPVGAFLALLYSYPFALLAVQAALTRTDPRQWEAARSLGASPWQAFWRVIAPGLRPAMASGGLLVALYAIGDFGAVSLTRYPSLSYLIYLRYKSLFDRDEAIYLSLLLVVVAVALVAILLALRGRAGRHTTTHGSHRQWPTIALGRWRWPALALCVAVVALGVVLPAAMVCFWLWRGLSLGHHITLPWAESATSLGLGVGAAALITALAVVPAISQRVRASTRSGPAGAGHHLITHLGYALPGIVVALAMVSFVTQYAYPLYQTTALIVAAYAIRFFPLGVHVVGDAAARSNPGLIQAARSLGCGPVSA